MVKKKKKKLIYKLKKKSSFCTYFIAAKSPANPMIFPTSSNEDVMDCSWMSNGEGENYTAVYKGSKVVKKKKKIVL